MHRLFQQPVNARLASLTGYWYSNQFWRVCRLRDYSALRASPLRGRPEGRSPPLRGVVEPGLLSVGGSNSARLASLAGYRYSNYFCVGLPAEGFEPPTYGLQNRCTTTVLSRHGGGHYSGRMPIGESLMRVAQTARPRRSVAIRLSGYFGARSADFSPNRSTAAWYSLARSRKRSLARVM
jgi:hypothetical protein